MAKQTEWNGGLYPSRRALAKHLGVSETTLSYWLKKGYKCDLSVTIDKVFKRNRENVRIRHLTSDIVITTRNANKSSAEQVNN